MREGDFSNCTDIDLMRDAIKYLQKSLAKTSRDRTLYRQYWREDSAEVRKLKQQIEAAKVTSQKVVWDEAWIQNRANEIMMGLIKAENDIKKIRGQAHIPYIPPHLPADALNLSSSSDGMDEIRRRHYGTEVPYQQVVDMAMEPNIKEPERTHYIRVLENAKAMADRLGLPIEKIRFNLFDSGLIKIHEPF